MTSSTMDRRLGLVGNTAIKVPVACATTGNITLSGEQTIDGVLTSSSRVLVKDQTNSVENGIYDSSTGAWTRSLDFNGNYDIVKGTLVGIAGGTQDGAYYEVTSANPITVGTSAITFETSVAAGNLAAQVASSASASYGAGMVGYDIDLAYASNTVGQKLNQYASVKDYGAVGNGTADDTAEIQAAITANAAVDMRGGTWKITGTITIPAGRFIDMRGANIVASCGTDPIFDFPSAYEGLYILHGAGSVTGTAGAFLHAEGSTTTPTLSSHYARNIRLEGVYVTSTTITKFLDFEGAVRQVFLDKCFAYTVNGILASGKCVEVMIDKSIIYSSTGAASTYGVKLLSPAGTSYFNEGWHFSDCTIDAFDTGVHVEDIFVLTFNGGYVSGGTYSFYFGDPTTTANKHITLSDFVCSQQIRFVPSGGQIYHGHINGVTFTGISGTAIHLANNTAAVSIRNCKFDTSTSGVAVVSIDNNADIVVDGIDCDSTYIGGVQIKGTTGASCSVSNINYRGTGQPVYIERPVLLKAIPIIDATVGAYSRVYNSGALETTYATTTAIATLSVNCAKGETGYIDVCMNASGMSTSQRFDLSLPSTEMVVPSGTGWNSAYIYPMIASCAVVAKVPYYCTADIAAGSLSLMNAAGNTVTIAAHSRFGIIKDF